MFVEKYAPKNLSDIVGQDQAVKKILQWFKNWKPGDNALLLHGPTGTGKTTVMEVLAREKSYDLIEMNASDYRSAEDLRAVLGKSVRERSLFKHGKIFMVDECDGLAGVQDRGATSEIMKIIKSSQHPIVLTATNAYDRKLRTLRKQSVLVKFDKIDDGAIRNQLEKICRTEKIKVDNDAIDEIIERADGDLRSAINDLEAVAVGKTKSRGKITLEDVSSLMPRTRTIDIFNGLDKIFSADTIVEARRVLDEVDVDPDTLMWWIEDNITRVYSQPEEIAKAFDALSMADIFKQRILARQNWRFFAYYVDMLTGGVAVAKQGSQKARMRYRYPSMIAILGRTKKVRREEKEKLAELAKQLHCSARKVREEFLPYLKLF